MAGQKVGVVGFGRIGRALAQKAAAVGFQVIAYDPFVADDGTANAGVRFVPLQALLKEADFVSLHTPLTSETEKMIGPEQINLMKPTAYLVNVSRGALIDEDALIKALEEKRLAGAGLDVLVEEPANPNNPLLKMEQVVVTSHTAFYSEEALEELQEKAAQKVAAALTGQIPQPLVNPEVLNKA